MLIGLSMGIDVNRTEIVFINAFVKNHELEMIVKMKKFSSYFFNGLFFPCPQTTLSLLLPVKTAQIQNSINQSTLIVATLTHIQRRLEIVRTIN